MLVALLSAVCYCYFSFFNQLDLRALNFLNINCMSELTSTVLLLLSVIITEMHKYIHLGNAKPQSCYFQFEHFIFREFASCGLVVYKFHLCTFMIHLLHSYSFLCSLFKRRQFVLKSYTSINICSYIFLFMNVMVLVLFEPHRRIMSVYVVCYIQLRRNVL